MTLQWVAGSNSRVIEIVRGVVRHAQLLHDAPRTHVGGRNIAEVKNKLPELIKAVENGEKVTT
jgi:hypothetical protein